MSRLLPWLHWHLFTMLNLTAAWQPACQFPFCWECAAGLSQFPYEVRGRREYYPQCHICSQHLEFKVTYSNADQHPHCISVSFRVSCRSMTLWLRETLNRLSHQYLMMCWRRTRIQSKLSVWWKPKSPWSVTMSSCFKGHVKNVIYFLFALSSSAFSEKWEPRVNKKIETSCLYAKCAVKASRWLA